MKKVAKIIVGLVVVVVALLVGGVFALNHYVQSTQFKEYVLAKTQEQLAVPLEVRELKASLFSGFELRGLVVNNPPGSQIQPLLIANTLVFRYRLLPLLHKKIAIETITLESPNIALEKYADGTWNYEKLTRPETNTSQQASAPLPAPTSATSKSTQSPPSGLEFEISAMALDHANVTVLKPEGKKLVQVTDLNVHSRIEGSGQSLAGNGELKIQNVSIIDSLDVSAIHSPIVVEQQQLKLPDLTARVGDGTLKSSVLVDLQKAGYPFTVHADVANVDVGKLGAKFSDKAQYLTGKLRLTTDLSGVGGDTNQLKGKGDAHIDHGTLAGIPLLQMVGELLNIPEVQRIQFDEITLEYNMDNGVIETPVIKLMSKDIQITGNGKTDFDFNLNHQLTLALSPSIMSRVPTEVDKAFGKRNDGFRTIDFSVTGPYDHPQTDLARKLAKSAAGSLIEEGLGDLLGGKKKKKGQ